MYLQVISSFHGTMEDITIIIPHRIGTSPLSPLRSDMPFLYVSDEGKGKKYALKKGISQATTSYVWLQDDDVCSPQGNINIQILKDTDLAILPLTMSSGDGSLLSMFQQIEYAAIQSLTMLAAEKGHPVMCSGANLIVNRERWLESWKDIHPELLSGDDMFLLESFKRRKLSVRPLYGSGLTAEVKPVTSIRTLLRQRMRWAGKAGHYTDSDIRICGMAVAMMNILIIICPPLLAVKYILDIWIIRQGKRFGIATPHHLYGVAFVLELIYPWYMLLCLFGGMFRKKKW